MNRGIHQGGGRGGGGGLGPIKKKVKLPCNPSKY